MEEAAHYETARRRATAKYGFYVHTAVYFAVMLLLVAINIITSPGTLWFFWPLLGWGIAVALHGARVFLAPKRNTIIDVMTEHELHRSDTDGRDAAS